MKNSWICDSESSIVKTPVMEIFSREYHSSEDDRKHTFYVLKSKNWCNVIPITEDGRIVLVKQYRVGIDTHTLEFPGGVADEQDATPEVSAMRELAEETGYELEPGGKCVSIGSSFTNPAILNNLHDAFIAGPVKKIREPELDEGEMIETVLVRIEEIPEYVKKGLIKHSLMLSSLFLFLMRSNEGEQALTSELQAFLALHPTPQK